MNNVNLSVIQESISKAFGQSVVLDESSTGLRATVFYLLTIAVASEMAWADKKIHPAEKTIMGQILGGLNLVPGETSSIVKHVLDNKTLAPFLEEESLRYISEPLDTTASTLVWGVAFAMAVADEQVAPEEQQLNRRLRSRLNVDFAAANALERVLRKEELTVQDREALLTVLHPAKALSLGVGPSRVATFLLSGLHQDGSAYDLQMAAKLGVDPTLEALAKRRAKILAVSERLNQIAAFVPSHVMQEANWGKRRLQEGRFQLTVLGEFSRGKSTLLNALLGVPILSRSLVPCNSGIVRLRYAKEPGYFVGSPGRPVSAEQFRKQLFTVTEDDVERRLTTSAAAITEQGVIELPHHLLAQGVELLDTPGLNEDEQLDRLVEAEAERSDAFLLVISALQPVTRLESEAIKQISARGKPLFVVCNFMNAVPPSQKPILEKRVRDSLAKQVPNADLRFAFVSAEPELLRVMGEESDTTSDTGIAELRSSLATFLSEERGQVELKSHHDLVKTLLETARHSISSKIAEDRETDERKRAQQRDNLHRGMEWLRKEVAEIPSRSQRMKASVRKFQQQLIIKTCAVADSVILDLANEIPAVSKRWKSDRSVLMPWELAKDFGSQVERYFSQQLNQRIQRALAPVIDELTKTLASDLGQDAASLYQTAAGLQLEDVSITAAHEDPEWAGERLVKAIVGVVLVGPAGLAAGAASVSHIIAMAISAFVVAFIIAFLGGGPITVAIGVAASTVLVVFLGAEGMKETIRDKLVKKVVEEIPGMEANIHAGIENELKKKGKAIEDELVKEVDHLVKETKARLKEAEDELVRFEESNGPPSTSRFESKLQLVDTLLKELES